MMSMNYEAIIIKIASDVLGMEPEKINIDGSKENMETWDSFAHLALISSIEEELGINIPFEKISEINSIRDILAIAKNQNGE